MSGFISVRLSKEERKRLLALKAERQCKSISQVVRLMLGFPRGTDEGIEGADDIESVDQMCQLVVRMVDRIDEQGKLLTKIARQTGVPLERKTLADLRAAEGRDYTGPERLTAVVETGPIDLNETLPSRNGDLHPAMPDGFARG